MLLFKIVVMIVVVSLLMIIKIIMIVVMIMVVSLLMIIKIIKIILKFMVLIVLQQRNICIIRLFELEVELA